MRRTNAKFTTVGCFVPWVSFVPWAVLCLGSFCAVGRFELGLFCASGPFWAEPFWAGPFCAYVVLWRVVLSLGCFGWAVLYVHFIHTSPVLPINCPISSQSTSPPTPCPHSVPRPIASPVWITFISSKRQHQLCGNTSWSGTLPWWCHLLHIYMVVILPSCISLLSGMVILLPSTEFCLGLHQGYIFLNLSMVASS